jgi:uncharacterized protein
MKRTVIINSRKFDGSIHRSWKCELVEETVEYWLFYGEFEAEILHPKLGVIRRKTASFEYYFKNKWFNIFRFHEPEGDLKFFYCNINMPPVLENDVLDYVDLDVDLLVKRNLNFEILDEDEYRENSIKYRYPAEVMQQVENNLAALITSIKKGGFPFSFK